MRSPPGEARNQGRLGQALFDVTFLLAQGHDDAHSDALPQLAPGDTESKAAAIPRAWRRPHPRSDLKAVRSSRASSCGCSQAAK